MCTTEDAHIGVKNGVNRFRYRAADCDTRANAALLMAIALEISGAAIVQRMHAGIYERLLDPLDIRPLAIQRRHRLLWEHSRRILDCPCPRSRHSRTPRRLGVSRYLQLISHYRIVCASKNCDALCESPCEWSPWPYSRGVVSTSLACARSAPTVDSSRERCWKGSN